MLFIVTSDMRIGAKLLHSDFTDKPTPVGAVLKKTRAAIKNRFSLATADNTPIAHSFSIGSL